jgi:type I restriction enzyme S subunit
VRQVQEETVRDKWKTVSLNDISVELSDGLHKAPVFVYGGEYLFVNATNLENGYIVEKDKAKRTTYEEFNKYGLPLTNRTILFSLDGTIGNMARYRGEKCVLGKGACYITLKDDMDVDYIYYLLQSPVFNEYIHTMATGSTIRHISLRTMRDFCFKLPPLHIQQQISPILKALDGKIELNNRINKTLEEIAQAIFKRWFVDFEFPDENGNPYQAAGGEMVESEIVMIPKGWRVGLISDICNVRRGASPRPIQDFMGGEYPWIKIADATASRGPFITRTKEFIKREGITKSVKVIPGDLILSNSATCGLPFFVDIEGYIHDGWLYFTNYRDYSKYYLYFCLLQCSAKLVSIADGSVQKNLNTNIVSTNPVLLPDQKVLKNFDNICIMLMRNILSNIRTSERLEGIRDTLLPRLLLGENMHCS